MATTQNDNSTLYFIVGGLVVLALVMAYVYMGNAAVITTAPQTTTERIIVPGAKTESNTTNYNFEAEKSPNTTNPPTPSQ